LKVKSILISQPAPASSKTPYTAIAEKHKIKVDYRQFIQVEGVSELEFRQSRLNIKDFTAVIFTSRNAIENFFRICKEQRYTVPDSLKYFCMSENTAHYLQNYITVRRRKVFSGNTQFVDLLPSIVKHKKEKFLLPCSDIHKQEISDLLTNNSIDFDKAVMYRTVASDLSDLSEITYDMLVFFSPSGIESLFKNFPDFKQNDTRIAAFGSSTQQAVLDKNLRLDVAAPIPGVPSMVGAIEAYIQKNNK
jgi:uroporphyrinogen-III synthase